MKVQLNEHFKQVILKATNSKDIIEKEVIQNLWSGYGKIVRYTLVGSPIKSIVVKLVRWPEQGNHPRGWNTNFSHQRKLKSYEVETHWYQNFSKQSDDTCRLPRCIAVEESDKEVLMVLEDMDASGFPARKTGVTQSEMFACLTWLANFHATFLNTKPIGLWETGTYWHLETRPEELEVLDDIALKKSASAIDQELKNSAFQTLVHGDAKLANFCFSHNGQHVSAVDFQYVGGGCGMKDIAYFIGSCLYEDDCKRQEQDLLNHYFKALEQAVTKRHANIDTTALEADWRKLYPVAWTDFHRFIKGWSPGHWKIHSYSERLAREVIRKIKQKIDC